MTPNKALEFIKRMVERWWAWFKLFWFCGDAVFANPKTYEYCEEERITNIIRVSEIPVWSAS